MTAVELFRERGVDLYLDGTALRYRAPQGTITPDVVAELRARKTELIAELRVRQHAEQACRDVPGITPAQFEALHSAARSYAEGIGNGRIRFGMGGRLIVHGVVDPEVAA